MKNVLSALILTSFFSCAHQQEQEPYLDKNFNPNDKTFTFKQVSEQKWQIVVNGEWDAETQKLLLKRLSQVGARNEFSYFKLEEGGRFPASEGREEGEEVIVEYSHLNSPDFYYSIDGILDRPTLNSEPRPSVHKRAREY
jgi:hypothetical protein